VLDSGCTNHKTGEKKMFTSFENNNTTSDSITFGDNIQGKVLGHGKIAITTKHSISKVLLVESLDYNLVSVPQLCEWATIVYSPIGV
jgi:Na+-transporting NADH:ubiquinone oxidoreductase subunit NqrB